MIDNNMTKHDVETETTEGKRRFSLNVIYSKRAYIFVRYDLKMNGEQIAYFTLPLDEYPKFREIIGNFHSYIKYKHRLHQTRLANLKLKEISLLFKALKVM